MDSHDRIVPSVREGSGLRLVSPELVGRDSEIAAIGELAGTVAAGGAATLLISSEAGLGKSALLARAIEIGRRAGLRALRAECMRIATNQGNPVREAIVQIAQEQYRQIGVAIDPDLMSFNALVQTLNDRRPFDGIVLGWGLGAEPGAYGIWHSGQMAKGGNNFIQFSRPELDAALAEGRDGPDCSLGARKAAFARVDLILNEEAPYVFLYSSQTLLANDPRLVRPAIRAWGSPLIEPDIQTWWVRP